MAIFSKAKIREIFEDAEIEVSKDVLKKICDLHTDALDNLKDTVKELKTDLENAERERDDYKAKAPKDGEETVSKSEYDNIKKELDDLKQDVEKKSTLEAKQKAYRELAKGIDELSETGIDKAVKYAKYDEVELDENGKIKDAEKHTEFIKSEWGGYKKQTTTQYNNPANPPANGGGSTKTKEEILAIKDTAKRQAEIAKNPALFGIKLD